MNTMERVFQNSTGSAFLDKGIFVDKELLGRSRSRSRSRSGSGNRTSKSKPKGKSKSRKGAANN